MEGPLLVSFKLVVKIYLIWLGQSRAIVKSFKFLGPRINSIVLSCHLLLIKFIILLQQLWIKQEQVY